MLSVLVVFVRDEVLNTDTYVSTVTPLASNPAIQSAVAERVSDRLVTEINVERRVKRALPRRAGFLASPIASTVGTATHEVALRLVKSSQFQTFWVEANRRAHRQVVALLTGSKQGALQSSNGRITLDLDQISATVENDLKARGVTLFDKLPTRSAPTITLFQSTALVRLQWLTRFLNRLYILLPIVTLLLYAGAIILNANRRRGLVRAAVALALSMGLTLVIASVARNQYLSSLSPSQSRPATEAVVDTVSAFLLDTVRTTFVVAAVIAVVAVVAGNASVRTWVKGRTAPAWITGGPVHDFTAAHRQGLQWTLLGLGLLLLAVWNQPTALVAIVVLLVALALVALVGLMARAAKREADTPGPVPADGSAGRRSRVRRARGRWPRSVPVDQTATDVRHPGTTRPLSPTPGPCGGSSSPSMP